MPPKKICSRNPNQDEGYSEEIQSDSSSESDSIRNTRRKKPQRRKFSKENRTDSLQQSIDKKGLEKIQEYSSEKSRRPPIVKIFRRIDRKAKHIYLVDDKMEDNNELVTSPKPKIYLDVPNKVKNPYPNYSPYDERFVKSNCTEQKSTNFREYSTRNVETDCGEHKDVSETNVLNPFSDVDSVYSSPTDIYGMYNESDFWNMPGYTDSSVFSMTNNDQLPNNPDVWNRYHDIDSYTSMTHIEQTPSRSDVCNLLSSNHSDISSYSEILDRQSSTGTDICIQQPSNNFNITKRASDEFNSESDSLEKFGQSSVAAASRSDVCTDTHSLLLSNYSDISSSSEPIDGQTSTGTGICIQQPSSNFNITKRASDEFNSESDSLEKFGRSSVAAAGRSDVCTGTHSLLLSNYSDISSSSETIDEQTSTETDVCIQQSISNLNGEIDSDGVSNESDSSEIFDGQSSMKPDVYNQQSDSDSDTSEVQ